MAAPGYLTSEQLSAIQRFDTCTVLNAIETFGTRLRNEGYARPGLQWLFPSMESMIGYAHTLRVKSSATPIIGRIVEDRTGWWSDLQAAAGPSIAVVQDIDEKVGFGAVTGEVNVAIMQRLGCVGLVTNGSVRDLSGVEKLKFAFFAGSVSPSHSYMHMIDHGEPVEINGLRIAPGDLLYADRNGLISIPLELADKIPEAAARQRAKECRIVELCRSKEEFSLDRLAAEVK